MTPQAFEKGLRNRMSRVGGVLVQAPWSVQVFHVDTFEVRAHTSLETTYMNLIGMLATVAAPTLRIGTPKPDEVQNAMKSGVRRLYGKAVSDVHTLAAALDSNGVGTVDRCALPEVFLPLRHEFWGFCNSCYSHFS